MRAPGYTLIEVTLVVTIMGLMALVTTVAVGAMLTPPLDPLLDPMRAARRDAIRLGEAVSLVVGPDTIVFRPDGSASTGRVVQEGREVLVDHLTGQVRDAR